MHPEFSEPPVDVGVLGAVVTRVNGTLTEIPGARARALLVALALSSGRGRSVTSLVDDVWSGEPPRSPKNALQTQVSRLRSVLPEGVLVSGHTGYRLACEPGRVDLDRAQATAVLAREDMNSGRPSAALRRVRSARSLWRGDPGTDLLAPALADELVRRSQAVLTELDDIEARVLLMREDFQGALPLVTRAHERDVLDERAAADLMRCLHGLGRTNDALTVFADVRRGLIESLGTDPSPILVELNAELLAPVEWRSAAVGLRASPNPLIGRAADVDAIETAMSRSRVVTILGPGGSGKTRIAHEIGLRAAPAMPVAFVELASLRRGQDVTSAIVGALGISETDLTVTGVANQRMHTARTRLHDVFGGGPGLLVLDNCEHLVDDVARAVDDLISDSDQLTVVTTSRSPLSIASEVTYPLPPLRVDGDDAAATHLFVSRARAVRPGVTFDPDDVRELCRTLDGLPLAIELAAARVRTMTVAEISTRLEHRFALLRSPDRTRPERHRTLHAVIEWSWDLLTPPQRSALTHLCRFPAGFTLDAAEKVAGVLSDDFALDDVIDGLVSQSLLGVVDEGDHVRYHMLETVREFGEEHLSEADAAEVTARMLAWAIDLTAPAAAAFDGHDQVAALEAIEAEHDNVVDVLRQAVHARRWRCVYAIYAAMSYYWSIRGAHSEVYTWAERLAALPVDDGYLNDDDLNDVDADHLVLTYVITLSHLGYVADVRAGARIRYRLRRSLRRRTVHPGLRFAAELLVSRADNRGLARALAVSARSRNLAVANVALAVRAALFENAGAVHQAARDIDAARNVADARGDVWASAMAGQSMGNLLGQSGRYEEAIDNYLRAMNSMRRLHAYDESAQMRGFAGAAMISAGRISDGRAFLQSALDQPEGGEVKGGDVRGGEVRGDDEHRRRAAVEAALAEAELAEGKTESGLRMYRRSGELSGFSVDQQGDGFLTMLASASVSAHALHSGAHEVLDEAALLEKVAFLRLGPDGFRDVPQLGAVACAIGSHDIHLGRDPSRGLRLLGASMTAHARQDYPSMRPERHLDAARAVLGAEVVDDAVAWAGNLTRAGAWAGNLTRAGAVHEIHELLRP